MGQPLHAALWDRAAELAERCVRHPFVEGLGDGTLAEEIFKRYVAQDAYFLRAYLSAYALCAARTRDLEAAALLAQSLELSGVKAKLASVEASHTGLMKIAAASVSNMRIGMNLAKADAAAMSPEMLLAEHASLSTQFAEHFKVGGVAALNVPEVKPEASTGTPHLHSARIAATRFSPNTK